LFAKEEEGEEEEEAEKASQLLAPENISLPAGRRQQQEQKQLPSPLPAGDGGDGSSPTFPIPFLSFPFFSLDKIGR
jgi:hypothetical protein